MYRPGMGSPAAGLLSEAGWVACWAGTIPLARSTANAIEANTTAVVLIPSILLRGRRKKGARPPPVLRNACIVTWAGAYSANFVNPLKPKFREGSRRADRARLRPDAPPTVRAAHRVAGRHGARRA